jgi:hypothetical protein
MEMEIKWNAQHKKIIRNEKCMIKESGNKNSSEFEMFAFWSLHSFKNQ